VSDRLQIAEELVVLNLN